MSQPYRRALLIQSLDVKSLTESALTDGLPELMTTLADGVGTSLVNMWTGKKKIKTLFKRKKKNDNLMTIPDGRGGSRKVRMI
jgi:hypothetical protein